MGRDEWAGMNGLAPIRSGRPWAMAMRWDDLAFLHWPVPVATLERFIPPDLQLETFDGHAWIGIVPFRMMAVHARGLPEKGCWNRARRCRTRAVFARFGLGIS